MLSDTPRTFVGSTTFTVTGRTGLACERVVIERIAGVAGVASVSVEPAIATVTVTVTVTEPVDRADIAAVITEAGCALLA